MTSSFRPPAPNVGRFTALILGLVAFLCVAMIGGTGYLKYQMDRAGTLLAAPDAAMGSDQDLFDRLRRTLGYGGFLGLAQNYALTHDGSGFATMKDDIRAADDIVAHLPDKTPAETRHDLVAIVGGFDAALQRINAPPSQDNGEFTTADLAPLYAALPVLDARVASSNAETRLAAENRMQFWGMLLTLVSWCSLIIAAACAAGIYLTLRDKHSAPMRALAQSIQNMARGDMRTAIWGTERQDMIGELARAVDIARYHFSHLPDLSLLSEQGPVRMRFEGGTRSLFEAMMKAISRDSENIRDQTMTLAEAVRQQKESIALMSDKVENVLQNILQHGQDGDRQIRHAIQEMVGSAESLKNAHAHAADQLNRLVPALQDRATGLTEIAHITGKQVAQTLQSLTASDMNLKANAEQAKDTMARLSSTADDLGERLFGAINLLQASGKVLAETTEGMSRAGILDMGIERSASAAAVPPETFEPLVERLEEIATQLTDMQGKLGAQIDVQNQAAEAQVGLLSVHSDGFLAQTTTTVQTLATAAEHLREGQAAFESALGQIQDRLQELDKNIEQHATLAAHQTEIANDKFDLALLSGFEQLLAERVEPKFATLEENLEKRNAISAQLAIQAASEGNGAIQTKLAELGQSIAGQMQKKLDEFAASMPAGLRQNFQEDLRQLSAQIDAMRNLQEQGLGEKLGTQLGALEQTIEQQMRGMFDAAAQSSAQTQDKMAALAGKLADLAHTMPAEVRGQMAEDLQRLSSQIDATVGGLQANIDTTRQIAQATHQELTKPADPITYHFPPELQKQMQDHWYQMAAQIEASRASIDRLFKEQVAGKLDSFEQALTATRQMVEIVREEFGKPPKTVFSLPPELQKQMHDHWYQVAAQIEASRASLAETISDQIDKMESRVAGKSANTLSRTASDYATQRQIEQQTHILSELVATLGVLDAHMQQIKSEMHAGGRN